MAVDGRRADPSCRTLFAGPQRVGGRRKSKKCQTYLAVRVECYYVKKIAQAAWSTRRVLKSARDSAPYTRRDHQCQAFLAPLLSERTRLRIIRSWANSRRRFRISYRRCVL